jgi:hypothetical protein
MGTHVLNLCNDALYMPMPRLSCQFYHLSNDADQEGRISFGEGLTRNFEDSKQAFYSTQETF